MLAFHVLVVLWALVMLAKHGRRAALFLAPSLMRAEGDAAAGPATPALARAGGELETMGFSRLGARRERGALGGLDLASDAWANEPEGAYADVLVRNTRGGGPPVYFLSLFPDGAVVLTANHHRLARSTDRIQTGGLPGAGLEATWAAHRVALGRFARRHGAPEARADLAARGRAARAWYRGPGRAELRRFFLGSFLTAGMAALVGAMSAKALARSFLASTGGVP